MRHVLGGICGCLHLNDAQRQLLRHHRSCRRQLRGGLRCCGQQRVTHVLSGSCNWVHLDDVQPPLNRHRGSCRGRWQGAVQCIGRQSVQPCSTAAAAACTWMTCNAKLFETGEVLADGCDAPCSAVDNGACSKCSAASAAARHAQGQGVGVASVWSQVCIVCRTCVQVWLATGVVRACSCFAVLGACRLRHPPVL